jgi:hypothetical protein
MKAELVFVLRSAHEFAGVCANVFSYIDIKKYSMIEMHFFSIDININVLQVFK